MSDKRKGIVDPWRKVPPLRPGPRPARPEGRKDLDGDWRDDDLAVPHKYVIRSKHVSFDVTSVRVETASDALDVLADCIAELWIDKHVGVALANANIGVRTRMIMYNAPTPEVKASRLESAHSMIWFIGDTIDEGMAKLGRILRHSAALPTTKRYGITTMLNT
jgi:hypothetical protein